MKFSRLWLLFGLVLILSISLVFGILSKETQRPNNESKIGFSQLFSSSMKMVTNITLILNYNNGENVTFHNLTLIGDISPYNATVVALGDGNIDKYFTSKGVFVKGMRINSVWYNGGQEIFWLCYVNGVLIGVSSSVFQLANNSIVEWRFTSQNPYSSNQGPNDMFWTYFSILLGIIAIATVGLIIIMKINIKKKQLN